jgi:Zn-dependent M28 family amino/carboxypeptidase
LPNCSEKNPPKVPVELVAYTLEEPPHFLTTEMGSAVHALSLRVAKQPVTIMIALEMIGYFRDETDSQDYPIEQLARLYGKKGDFIAVVGRLSAREIAYTNRIQSAIKRSSDLPARVLNAPSSLGGVDLSDHQSYWKEGFPAIMVTDTAFFRNPNYHGANDTADTLDYVRMAKVVKGVFAAIQDVAS